MHQPYQKKSPVTMYILFGLLGLCTLAGGSCAVCVSQAAQTARKKIADDKKALADARARSSQITVMSLIQEPPKDRALMSTLVWRNGSAETVEAVLFRIYEPNAKGEWLAKDTILITADQPVPPGATSTITLPIDYRSYPPPARMELRAEAAYLKPEHDKLRPLSER